MKIRAFRGKWLSRKKRKHINNLLQSAKPINREELEKEAKEFEEYMLQRKKNQKKKLILENITYGTNPGRYLKITDEREDAEIERLVKTSKKYDIPLGYIVKDIMTEFNLPREEVLKGIRIKEVKKY